MKIAVACPYALSRPGGVQGQALGLASKYRQLGHETMLIAPDDERPIGRHDNTIVVGRPLGIRANGSVAPVALAPGAYRRATRALKDFDPDVVHVHEPFAPLSNFAAMAVPAVRVATFHRADSDPLYRGLRPIWRHYSHRFDAAVAVSEAAAMTARPLCRRDLDIKIWFNGVDLDRFTTARPLARNAKRTVVFVGRLEPRKGVDVLLEAMAHLGPDTDLWIIGTGSLGPRPTMPNVHWLGSLDDMEIAERLGAADVFCAPSLSGESFGVVVLEAMAAGTAVVCSDLPGYRQAAGDCARYVQPGNATALAAELDRTLTAVRSDDEVLGQCLDRGKARAEMWSMSALADAYLGLFAAQLA